MTPEDRIARLQALLERVLARKRNGAHAPIEMRAPVDARPPEPATNGKHDVSTPVAAFFPSSPPPPAVMTKHPSATPPKPPAPPTIAPDRDASLDATLVEVAITSPRQAAPPPRPEPSQVRAIAPPPVEPPPMEVIELEIDPDPSIPPPPPSSAAIEEPLESRSRLVSAPPAATDLLDDDLDEPSEPPEPLDAAPAAPSDPTIEVGAVEVGHLELEAMQEDRAPSSSRRPISIEEKMSEEDDVPLHAPPPESGELVAAAPSIDMGFDMESTGVRRYEPLAPEAARVDAPAKADVALFVGHAPKELAETTFGELLDRTLGL